MLFGTARLHKVFYESIAEYNLRSVTVKGGKLKPSQRRTKNERK